MTLLTQYRPPDAALARWVRDVRRALTGEEEGIRWADNIGPLVTGAWNTTAAPVAFRTTVTREPLAVVCLRAVRSDGTDPDERWSWCPVKWTWDNGNVSVETITGPTVSIDYDVTFGLLMG